MQQNGGIDTAGQSQTKPGIAKASGLQDGPEPIREISLPALP